MWIKQVAQASCMRFSVRGHDARGAALARAIGLLGLLTLCMHPALALDPDRTLTQYVHRIWQTQQGLPPGSVGGIFQTRDGYLWLSTQSGLIRFDGVRFTPAESIFPGAPANVWIRPALEDSQGALWIGSSDDAGLYRITPSGSAQYTTAQGLPSNLVQCLVASRDGSVWACTDHGLARLGWKPGNLQVRTFHPADGLTSDNIRAACE